MSEFNTYLSVSPRTAVSRTATKAAQSASVFYRNRAPSYPDENNTISPCPPSDEGPQSEPDIRKFLAHDADLPSEGDGDGPEGAVGLRHQAQVDTAQSAAEQIMGALAGRLVYEVSQPLGAMLLDSDTGLRWLYQSEFDVAKVRDLMRRILEDARRASDILARIRAIAAGQARLEG